jgi:hypothetical protein
MKPWCEFFCVEADLLSFSPLVQNQAGPFEWTVQSSRLAYCLRVALASVPQLTSYQYEVALAGP